MAISPPARYLKPFTTNGFTLIEVLVALAIIAIAMTAIIHTVSQNIRSSAYLKDKTAAAYVAQQVLNEARLGLLPLPAGMDKLTQKTDMLGNDWYWTIHRTETPNPHIVKLTVNVYSRDPEQDEIMETVAMEAYAYAP